MASGECTVAGSQVGTQRSLQGNSGPQTAGEGKGLTSVSFPVSSNATVIKKTVPVRSCSRQEL